ncbi:MAG: GIN domain-containing protein [Hyphomicrobiales bacterium]
MKHVLENLPKVMLMMLFSIFSPSVNITRSGKKTVGNGTLSKEKRAIKFFNNIHLSGCFEAEICEGDIPSVEIEADENIQGIVKVDVDNNTLEVSTNQPAFNPTKIKIVVTVDKLDSLHVEGNVDVLVRKSCFSGVLELNAKGVCRLNMDMNISYLNCNTSGACKLNLRGNVNKGIFNISGISQLRAVDLDVDRLILKADGACECFVNANQLLHSTVSGLSKVSHKCLENTLVETERSFNSVVEPI